jgi:hypothetical protein
MAEKSKRKASPGKVAAEFAPERTKRVAAGPLPPVAGAGASNANPLAWAGFSLVLAACCAWIVAHAYMVDRVTVRLCGEADRGLSADQRLPVFLNEIAFDGYTWNRLAEDLGKNGDWRLRHTDFDNAPHGREVHWNSAFAGYLRGLGELFRAATGDTLRRSIFRMSIWANPILLLLVLGIFSTLSARRFGPLCGAVIALGMVAVPTFYEGFMPAYPDHHGLIAFALFGLIFGIAWAGGGWVQPPDGPDFAAPRTLARARHGMMLSAMFGAAGLWISALSTAIVLGTVGAAALAAAAFYARPGGKGEAKFDPSLWKTWAAWGACAALAFYLIEYFPFEMGMRMEVNHPLYAIAWLGGGWTIATIGAWLQAPSKRAFPWKPLAWPLAACAVLPAVILVGGEKVYVPGDPFMGRLWKNIAELLPLLTRIKLGGLTWGVAVGWFPLFIAGALSMQFSPKPGRGTKAVMVFLAVPILLVTALQFYQTRWGMLAGPLYIALAAIVVPQAWRLVPRRPGIRVVAAALLAGLGCFFVQPTFMNSLRMAWGQFSSRGNTPISPGQGLALLHRKMARAILDDADGRPVVLLSSPNSSCILSALGGFRTVGTLYWENSEGLKAAAKALNAQSDQEALDLLSRHGITHVSLMTWENFIGPYFGLLYPKPADGISCETAFAKRALFDKVIPPWTRPLVFQKNELTAGLGQDVLLLRVAPGQPDAEVRTSVARFARLVEGNAVASMIALREILDSHPRHAPARVELALLKADQRFFDEAASLALEALPDLPVAERARAAATFAGLFTDAGRPDLAAPFAALPENP